MQVNVPTIQSIGPPPERHASRVVIEMCRYLFGEQENFRQAIVDAAKVRRSKLGSPVAQKRHCDRFLRATRGSVVGYHLKTGKRGRFLMGFVFWRVVWPAPFGDMPKLVRIGEGFPHKPWLTCEMVTYEGPKGEVSQTVEVVVTHHAMQRLAECGEVRTPWELITSLQGLWNGLFPGGKRPKEGIVRVPVAGGMAICEVAKDGQVGVKTVLRPGMFEEMEQ